MADAEETGLDLVCLAACNIVFTLTMYQAERIKLMAMCQQDLLLTLLPPVVHRNSHKFHSLMQQYVQ